MGYVAVFLRPAHLAAIRDVRPDQVATDPISGGSLVPEPTRVNSMDRVLPSFAVKRGSSTITSGSGNG